MFSILTVSQRKYLNFIFTRLSKLNEDFFLDKYYRAWKRKEILELIIKVSEKNFYYTDPPFPGELSEQDRLNELKNIYLSLI